MDIFNLKGIKNTLLMAAIVLLVLWIILVKLL